MILPRLPKPGAGVSLIAPSGPLPEGAIERAVARVRELGWEPILGRNAHHRTGYLAGDDGDRLADLNAAISSTDADVIWPLRGGYGTMRLLPGLDLRDLRSRPRPFIGFSDNTVLHLAANRQGVVSFHGPHSASPDLSDFSVACIKSVLKPEAAGILPQPVGPDSPVTVVPGLAEGPLIGGNLSLLTATVGTPYQVQAEGSILFIEEVGEPAYKIDRMLTQLLLANILWGVAGIAVGAFSDRPDWNNSDIPDPSTVLLDRLGKLGIPVVYGLPFGHIAQSWTLPVGVRARLDASATTLEILEPAVAA